MFWIVNNIVLYYILLPKNPLLHFSTKNWLPQFKCRKKIVIFNTKIVEFDLDFHISFLEGE
jgi:hypothetical protein